MVLLIYKNSIFGAEEARDHHRPTRPAIFKTWGKFLIKTIASPRPRFRCRYRVTGQQNGQWLRPDRGHRYRHLASSLRALSQCDN